MSAPNIGPGSGSGSGSAQMAGSVPGSYFPLHAAPGPPPSMMTGESPQRSTVSASNANTSSSEVSWEGHVKAAGGPGGIIGGGRSVSIAEGQQFITITPSYGDEIHVPVDVHQASKQADEKRLRNAGASARFRARKKEKDREAQIGIQRLEAVNRDLQKRNQELEAQRDFYRNERNRLRHIMSQSPSMREYIDSGPPSPASTSLSATPNQLPHSIYKRRLSSSSHSHNLVCTLSTSHNTSRIRNIPSIHTSRNAKSHRLTHRARCIRP
ncbi:hypothetical protein SPBR_02996 [Sporothrix brasiliensis 5110]|uniref:BZIP domain-containing protein n=1 Tax=Sporothrix brasiliensis 5110 TaxID=1398154 RepID=A0A0C2FPJ8_9PEZI|nr:uncharacterized protein SPBR_02996 [Sporothrix brasiliensis 5110]KIH92988.1 hypothetical protein SPBR_02996 [Sporothrix brasiliensis 5110]